MEEKKECPCPKKNCTRHGKCDECRSHHAANKKYPPYCERQKQRSEELKDRETRRPRRG